MKNKKKAPKIKKYEQGGEIQHIKDAEFSTAITPLNKGKKLKDSSGKEIGSDYLRYMGKSFSTPLGLNNATMFQEDKFNTKVGKKGSDAVDKYAAPVTRGAVAAVLSIYGTPAAGSAYLAATSAVDKSQKEKYNKKNAQLKEETDFQYQNRMSAKGIDINDTRTGLQGTEGIVSAGISAGYGLANEPKTTEGAEGFKGLVKKKKSISSDLSIQKQEEELNNYSDNVNDYGTQYGKKGMILQGKSHEQGGIKFNVKGGGKAELEGGEIVLTKKVAENPMLLAAVSKINQMAGGKALEKSDKTKFGDGDIIANARKNVNEKNGKEQSKKALEDNIKSSKKDIELYKRKGYKDEAIRAQKELDNFQIQYNKEYPKTSTTKTGEGIAKSGSAYAPTSTGIMVGAGAVKGTQKPVATSVDKGTGSGIAKAKTGTAKSAPMQTLKRKEVQLDGYSDNNLTADRKPLEKTIDAKTKQELATVKAQNVDAQVPDIDKKTLGSKYPYALETGLGIFQAIKGQDFLNKAGKRPNYTIPSELTNSYGRATADSRYGFDAATGQAYKKNIEEARIQNIALANQVGGGNAAAVQNNARAATNQYGQGMLNFYSKDAQLQLQKKQYADQLGKAVASEKDRGFQYNMDAFNQNQKAGADLLGAGISNIFTMRKNQRELDAQNKFGTKN